MFDLSDKKVRDILFAMENQNEPFMVDARDGRVVPVGSDDDDDEVLDLVEPPSWTSPDGFALMGSFAAGVSDALARGRLEAALAKGRGVFKAFKATLEDFPEISKRWYDYKEAAMFRRIHEWYDALREARGLERLGDEPEEDEDLLLGDFSFHDVERPAWELVEPMFKRARDEALADHPAAIVDYEYGRIEKEIEEFADSIGLIAEAPGGAPIAVAVALRICSSYGAFGKLAFLYVAPEQRGLGLGLRLVELTRERLAKDGIARFIVALPFLPEGFGEAVKPFGYEAYASCWLSPAD